MSSSSAVPSLSTVPCAPTFYPSSADFAHPYAYIRSIQPIAAPYGICKIVPPAGWRAPCALSFDSTRFGTKAQRIDQLIHRGDPPAPPASQVHSSAQPLNATKRSRRSAKRPQQPDEGKAKAKRPVGRPRKWRGTGQRSSGAAEEGEDRQRSQQGHLQGRKDGEEQQDEEEEEGPVGWEERSGEVEDGTGLAAASASPSASSSSSLSTSSSSPSSPVSPSAAAGSAVGRSPASLSFTDSPSFLCCLSAFLSSLTPPQSLPSEVLLPSTPTLPLNLFTLYQRVVYCGGVEQVASTLGWTLVLEECGVSEQQQQLNPQLHEVVRSLWNKWCQPLYTHLHTQQRAQRQGQGKEEDSETEEGRGEEKGDAGEAAVDGDGKEERPGEAGVGWEMRRSKRRRVVLAAAAASAPAPAPAAAVSAPVVIRRSARERKRLRMSSESMSALSSSLASSPFIDSVCAHCEQFDHHSSKVRCSLCSQVYHTFCLSPSLPSPSSSSPSSASASFVCRPCEEREQGEFGFDAGGFYSLAQFKRRADAFKAEHFHLSAAGLHSAPPSPQAICAEFWRIVTQADHSRPVQVEYGSDLDTQEIGSVFPALGPMRDDGWNLRNLPRSPASVLNLLDDASIEGISIPWLYVGMLFSAFCWHNEDHYSYSINYVSEGADKQWYGVGAAHAAAFERTISAHLPHLFSSTPDLLFHLITMMDPNLLLPPSDPATATSPSVCQVLQRAGEIVITFPQAYHCGFNHGFNVAESVNFAPYDWLVYGLQCTARYRYFHRQPVWCCEQVVLSAARQLLAEVEARRSEAGKGEGGAEAAERRRDEEAKARGELPLWERAAWTYSALRRVRDEEYQLRRALYLSGTTRMQPWVGAALSPSTPRFAVGDPVKFSASSTAELRTAGTILACLGDGWYRVKRKADGVVVQVEERRLQREEKKDEQRTHDWHEFQNFGQPDDPSLTKLARARRMAAATPASSSSSPSSIPSSSLPRCLVCRQFLYLSCVQCSCTLDKYACLRHSQQLCDCLPQSKFALFRHSLAELDRLVTAIAVFLGVAERACSAAHSAPNRDRPVHGAPLPRPAPSVAGVLQGLQAAPTERTERALAIIAQGEAILNRGDEHVEDTQRRMLRLHGGAADEGGGGEAESLVVGSRAPTWSEATELSWQRAADDWERRHRPYLDLTQPSLTLSEAEGILKEGERFIWGDQRMDSLRTLYTAIHSWTQTSTSLSLTLCSLMSAHRSLQAQLAALQEAVPHSPLWQSLVSLLFSSTSTLPGVLFLDEARELHAAIERCPVFCVCVCKQIEGRFQAGEGAEGGRKGAVAVKAEGGDGHQKLLAQLLEMATAQWEHRLQSRQHRRWPALLPHLPMSAALHEGLSYAASAVLLPDHQVGLRRGKAALLDPFSADERKESDRADDEPNPHLRPADVEEKAEAVDVGALSPPFLSSSDFDWPSLPVLPAEADCAVVLSSPLPLNDAVDVASLHAELSRCMRGGAPTISRPLLFCCAAFTALFSPDSPLPSLSALTLLYQQLQLPSHSGGRERQLVLQLRGCVAERLQRAQVWLAHCARLLSTSRDGEGGTDKAGKKAEWLGSAVGHLAVVRGVVCRCPPLLSLDPLAVPSIALCSASHGRDLTSLLKPRFAVCCVEALLSSTALRAVELHEMRDLLVGAKKRTDRWARRVLRLPSYRPSPATPATPPIASAPAPSAGEGARGSEEAAADANGEANAGGSNACACPTPPPCRAGPFCPPSAPPSSSSPSSPSPVYAVAAPVARIGVSTLLGLYCEGAAMLFSHSQGVPALQRRLGEVLDFQDSVRAAAQRMRLHMEQLEQKRLAAATRRWLRGEMQLTAEVDRVEAELSTQRQAMQRELRELEGQWPMAYYSLEEQDWLASLRRRLSFAPRALLAADTYCMREGSR